jgi:ABC-2 type transport system ATP-binding protein
LIEVARLDGAEKDYGSKKIGPLSFSVNSGEVLGLLGPNGAGKSTSIRMLLGLLRPTLGKVTLMGLDPLHDHVKALRDVGYSPELPNLQTFLTPRELLGLMGRLKGMKGDELQGQISGTLEEVGLLAYQDQKVGKLSKGMVQRLSVAQAMLSSPTLMILDEPMIGVDPAGVVHFRELFRRFVDAGGTIIISSHIMSEVQNLCTGVALVHSGTLIYKGGIQEFIEKSLESRTLLVEVRAQSDDVLAAIENLPGVQNATRTERGYAVSTKAGFDPRSEIAKIIVDSGAGLLYLGYGREELDQAYIEAIRKSNR